MLKKFLLIIVLFCCAATAGAEALRLKNGTILTGQIVERGQYTLNFKTKYGVVTVAQRDIVEELPDKQRILLKGGGEIIGAVEDITQFNVRVKTDGGYVNVDMPKIDAIEVYDYESAEKQKKYVEQTLADNAKNTDSRAKETAATGISFDEDLDRAFAAKSAPAPDVVEYTVVRGSAPAQAAPVTAAPEAREVYRAPTPAQPAVKPEENKSAKQEKQSREKKTAAAAASVSERRYVAVEAGVVNNKFKVNNGQNDVGGMGVGADIKYLWRLFKTNLWLGPGFMLASIPKSKFNSAPAALVNTDGQMFHFNLVANYYLTPKSAFQTYITASAGYESSSINLRSTDSTDPAQPVYTSAKASSSGFVGSAGLGVERKFGDTSLGLEGRYYSATRGGDLKGSPSGYYSAMLKASWKF
ncbi:MAG: hypothetical protein LBI01_03925 [Elusimicrobium sp.]|jgi:hypothetical protein|nr:hypothetical protein [Elusimicrobium sp.]